EVEIEELSDRGVQLLLRSSRAVQNVVEPGSGELCPILPVRRTQQRHQIIDGEAPTCGLAQLVEAEEGLGEAIQLLDHERRPDEFRNPVVPYGRASLGQPGSGRTGYAADVEEEAAVRTWALAADQGGQQFHDLEMVERQVKGEKDLQILHQYRPRDQIL